MKLKLQALTLVWLLSTTLGMRTNNVFFLKPNPRSYELNYKFNLSEDGTFTTPIIDLFRAKLIIEVFPCTEIGFKNFLKGKAIFDTKLPKSYIEVVDVFKKQISIKIKILKPLDTNSNETIRNALNGPVLPVLQAKQARNKSYVVRLHVETNLEAFVNDQELKNLDPIRKIEVMKKMVKLLKEFVTAKFYVTDLKLGDFGINVEGSKKVSEVEIPKFDSQVKIYFLSVNKLEVKQIIDSDYEKKLVGSLGLIFYKLHASVNGNDAIIAAKYTDYTSTVRSNLNENDQQIIKEMFQKIKLGQIISLGNIFDYLQKSIDDIITINSYSKFLLGRAQIPMIVQQASQQETQARQLMAQESQQQPNNGKNQVIQAIQPFVEKIFGKIHQ